MALSDTIDPVFLAAKNDCVQGSANLHAEQMLLAKRTRPETIIAMIRKRSSGVVTASAYAMKR